VEVVAVTEQEWLECKDPMPMLEFVRGKVSDRKLRLLLVACCNRVEHLVPDELGQQEFKVPEVFTIEQAQEMDAWLFRKGLQAEASMFAPDYQVTPPDVQRLFIATANVCWATARIATRASGGEMFGPAFKVEQAAQAILLRDIFENPFRPFNIAPAWLSNEVVMLAGHVYQDRAFDRLPSLADVLMDVGCNSEEVIAHCRGNAPHVRGCWLIDLLLGKS
jgi:hypothetical protein